MSDHWPGEVVLSDLTVRDGFQAEAHVVPTEAKLYIIGQLVEAGFKQMEVTAFAP